MYIYMYICLCIYIYIHTHASICDLQTPAHGKPATNFTTCRVPTYGNRIFLRFHSLPGPEGFPRDLINSIQW